MAFWYDTWSVNCLGVSKKNSIMVLGKRQRQPGGLKIQPVGLEKILGGPYRHLGWPHRQQQCTTSWYAPYKYPTTECLIIIISRVLTKGIFVWLLGCTWSDQVLRGFPGRAQNFWKWYLPRIFWGNFWALEGPVFIKGLLNTLQTRNHTKMPFWKTGETTIINMPI